MQNWPPTSPRTGRSWACTPPPTGLPICRHGPSDSAPAGSPATRCTRRSTARRCTSGRTRTRSPPASRISTCGTSVTAACMCSGSGLSSPSTSSMAWPIRSCWSATAAIAAPGPCTTRSGTGSSPTRPRGGCACCAGKSPGRSASTTPTSHPFSCTTPQAKESHMSRYLIHNVRVFDSISPESYPGWVLVTDQRIEAVGNHATAMPRPEDAQLVDGNGGTLMPGLIEPHGHISFPNGKSADFTAFPVEEAMLETVRNAKTALDCGYTSVFSAASLKPRLDVVLKREIEAGRVPGPRYKACSPELTVTGGLGDTNKMHLPWIANTTFSWVVDGADEVRRAARMFAREGVDNLKVHLSGDLGPSSAASSEQTPMSQAELEALVEVARVSELNLVCHARSAASVKSALKYGIGIINHANYADEEALDGLEQAKDWAMVIPAIGITHALAYSDGKWDFPRHRMPLFQRELEITIATVQEMRKR